ncbi:MAG: alpha/beta hydrolase [Mycolicibacterium sp.]|nr:alpha/beta hydrolase [Mycolicibacterium sp.]
MPHDNDFHPDLRRVALLAPRRLIGRRSMPLMRSHERLQTIRVPDGVDVVALGDGAGVRLFRPAGMSTPSPALLWIHGGGYVIGRAAQDDGLCRRFCNAVRITVASVEYRLAPENPYPAALDDCYTALAWLAARPEVDAARVVIGGASAGGGLAAALALMARDRGELTPVLQLLTYPMLDDRSSSRTDLDPKRFRLWNQRSNAFGWASYLAGADPSAAVPARREDLSGLPPAWIGVGTHDLFFEEDLAYAERLKAAGVPCEVEVVRGAFHGFDRIVPRAGVSRAFFSSQCAAIRSALV